MELRSLKDSKILKYSLLISSRDLFPSVSSTVANQFALEPRVEIRGTEKENDFTETDLDLTVMS